jgi:rhamnulokinase
MKVIAIDLGATSGRVMTVSYQDGRFSYEENLRFPNRIRKVQGRLVWDFSFLMDNIRNGLTVALLKSKDIRAIGIDTWGVDYGLIDASGELVKAPGCYRDPLSYDFQKTCLAKIPFKDIYAITGIQNLHFNTIYQLAGESEDLSDKKLLLIPDLIAYELTGQKRMELTNASTTSLFDRTTMMMSTLLCQALNLPKSLFAPLIQPGESYGPLQEGFLPIDTPHNLPVIAVGTHDTASAVLGASGEGDFAYLSSGTWSLLGTELAAPILSEASRKENFTNEIGYGNTIRYLKNTMGMFLANEVREDFKKQGKDVPVSQIAKTVLSSKDLPIYLDTNDPAFETPGEMVSKVNAYLQKTGQPTLTDPGEMLRVIYQSMALSYRKLLLSLEKLTGKAISSLLVVGGGNQATVLNQFTANSLGLKVVTGASEATVYGNALAQFIALGAIENVKEGRHAIQQSIPSTTYEPTDKEIWNAKYKEFIQKTNLKGEN